MRQTLKNKALRGAFATLFLDIMSFGMVIPLSPILAREFGAGGLETGLLISIYSLCQFVCAPFWGRFSDISGRRPVILFCLAGTAAAHLLFAFSTTLAGLFLSRALAGFFGGNILAATARIADVTGRAERSSRLTLTGLAFGLGFTLGPALGGAFILLGQTLGAAAPFGAHFASIGAAVLEGLNLLQTLLFFKESGRRKPLAPSLLSRARPRLILQALRAAGLGQALLMSCFLWLALAQIEPTLILLVQDDFRWEKTHAYWGFAYIGLLMAFSQGFLARKAIPRLGERKVSAWGLKTVAAGLFAIALAAAAQTAWPNSGAGLALLAFAVTLFSIGYSFAAAGLNGAISLLSKSEEQGSAFGVNQSLTSLARIIGPALGGALYSLAAPAPFLSAGALALLSLRLLQKIAGAFPNDGHIRRSGGAAGRVGGAAGRGALGAEDEGFLSIEPFHLKNLLLKRLRFHFFKLEALDESEAENSGGASGAGGSGGGGEGGGQSAQGHAALEPLGGGAGSALASGVSSEKDFVRRQVLVAPLFEERLLISVSSAEPIVLICRTGEKSQTLARELRAKGYKNCYFVLKGAKGLQARS